MDAGMILIVVVGALILAAFAMTFVHESRVDRLLAQADAEEERRSQAAPSVPLPSIPIEPIDPLESVEYNSALNYLPPANALPIPEYQDYQLEPEAAHLPTWTPTVSHYPDQQDVLAETVSQDDFDAIGDHEGDD